MRAPLLASLLAMTSMPSSAAVQSQLVAYSVGGTAFESVVLFDDATKKPRPGLVLVPNWMGVNEDNLKQASEIAAMGYVVFVADVYGKAARPKTPDDAGKLAQTLKTDRGLLRSRVKAALDQLLATPKTPLDAQHVGAIGFCFGGTAALELARSGAKLGGVVSIHGGLSSPTPDDAKNIKARVLALHGADDPFVPPDEVKAFEEEMRGAKLDWQLIKYGNAVHSFTDPTAKAVGKAEYNPKVTQRAWRAMNDFFAETFR